MPANDIYECRFRMAANNQLGECILHYKVANVVAPEPGPADIALAMETTIGPDFQNLASSKATWIDCTVQRVAPLPRQVHWSSNTLFGPCAGAATLLPTATCGLIAKYTTLAGHANRGRAYIPFPGEADNDDNTGRPTNAYVVKLNTLRDDMIIAVPVAVGGGSLDMLPVIFHRSSLSSTPLSICASRQFWATQRRRSDFGRPNLF